MEDERKFVLLWRGGFKSLSLRWDRRRCKSLLQRSVVVGQDQVQVFVKVEQEEVSVVAV